MREVTENVDRDYKFEWTERVESAGEIEHGDVEIALAGVALPRPVVGGCCGESRQHEGGAKRFSSSREN